ncbi:hypothetical protein TIFTF001_002673 [Ficus carica]|uniref:Uncharacterized protein n=1 Tax=Ficus carica TaxID=3494 RepID=A0AA88CU63_FICCA|nr:hypothetical protein TIFTF001_002673 [Ficus carica]
MVRWLPPPPGWIKVNPDEKAFELGWFNLWVDCYSVYFVELFHAKSEEVPWKLRKRWVRALEWAFKLNAKCPYRARNYGVVGAASLFPTQTIVQPDLTRVGTTQASSLAIILAFHHLILDLVLIIRIAYIIAYILAYIIAYIITYIMAYIKTYLDKYQTKAYDVGGVVLTLSAMSKTVLFQSEHYSNLPSVII